MTALAMGSLVVFAAPAHAAIAYKADTSATTGGGGSNLTINKPAGVVTGDFMIAEVTVESGNGTTITPPTNNPGNPWTLVLRTDNSGNVGTATYRKFADANDAALVSYTWDVQNKKSTGGIIAYTGVNTTTPLDVAAVGASNTTATGIAPDASSVSANTVRLAFYGSKVDVASHAQPTSMTQQFFQANDGNGFESSANDEARPTVGAVGAKNSAFGTSTEWVAQTVILRASVANTCVKSGANLNITMTAGGTVTIGRSGSNFNVTGTDITDTTCGGATVSNIDTVNVTGGSANDTVTIDLSNGQFEPSVGAADTETAEIEFAVNLAGGTSDKVNVQGGSGNDTLDATPGGIKLNSDSDTDVTNTAVEAVELKGGGGADTLKGSTNAESLTGEEGNDFMVGGSGADILSGGNGDDFATGGNNGDIITGGDGDDSLLGRAGSDDLEGGNDNDSLSPGGGTSDDAIDGGAGRDTGDYGRSPTAVTVDLATVGNGSTDPTGNQNTVGAGSDDVTGVESLRGSNFDDTLRGDGNDNFIFGWGGVDLIEGRAGNDALSGGAGNDTLNGEAGNDVFHGGADTDDCNGGADTDDFSQDEGTCETETQ